MGISASRHRRQKTRARVKSLSLPAIVEDLPSNQSLPPHYYIHRLIENFRKSTSPKSMHPMSFNPDETLCEYVSASFHLPGAYEEFFPCPHCTYKEEEGHASFAEVFHFPNVHQPSVCATLTFVMPSESVTGLSTTTGCCIELEFTKSCPNAPIAVDYSADNSNDIDDSDHLNDAYYCDSTNEVDHCNYANDGNYSDDANNVYRNMVKHAVTMSGKQVPPKNPAPRKGVAMKVPRVPAEPRVQPGGAGERAAVLEEQRALARRVRENLMKKGTYEIKKCEEARFCSRMPRNLPCDYCESFSKPMLEFRYLWVGTTPAGRPYDERDDVWLHNDKAEAPEAKDAFWLSLAGVDYNDPAAIEAYLSGERYRPPVGYVPAPWAPRADAVPDAIGAWARHGPPEGHVAPVMPAEDDPHAEVVIRFVNGLGVPLKRRDGAPLPSIVIRSDMVSAMRMAYRNGSRGKGKTITELLNLHRFADFARAEDLPKKIRNIISKELRGPVFGEGVPQPAPAAVVAEVVEPPVGQDPVAEPPVAEEPVEDAEMEAEAPVVQENAEEEEPAQPAAPVVVPFGEHREAAVRALEARMAQQMERMEL